MPALPILELQRQYELLKLEYNYEKELFLQQTDRIDVDKKVRKGICWYPLSIGRSYYNSLNQFVVEIFRTENEDIDHHFEFGRPVLFFDIDTYNNKTRYVSFTATVNYVEDNRMVVILPDSESLIQLQNMLHPGIQLSFDENTFKLMFASLNAVINDKNGRLSELRDIFHGTRPATELTFSPIRFPWLNASQEKAVNKVLCAKDVAIVHGPPGTGKTTTLVEAIYETLHRENQVLVCAQSNMAVDWISEKLVDRGIPVLRIGNPVRVNDKMLSFTYERRFESHPDYPLLFGMRRTIRQLYETMRKGHAESIRQKINSLRDRADELEMRIHESLFCEARVVACTLTGAANKLLFRQHFATLFIDEAAQALEAACWIAIRKAGRVILAGDHCQLPPIVTCHEAMKGGLAQTLMQKIATNKLECVSLLNIQYRMNDAIMRFSSQWFYHNSLQSAPEVKYRGILDYDTPIEWINTETSDAEEEFVEYSYGRINKAEAELTLKHLETYLNKIGKQRILEERIDIGLISPYQAQVQYLRRQIKKRSFFTPYRKLITIDTVDGFQGQERDIIVISLVRSNDKGAIGFLNDLRRMNVAITRARMKLIILGNAATLTHNTFYKQLFEYISSLED